MGERPRDVPLGPGRTQEPTWERMRRPTAASRAPLSGRARTHPRASSWQWWGPRARAWRGEGAAPPWAEGKGQRLAAHRGEGPGLQEPKSPAEAPLVLGHLSSRRCFTDEGGRPGGQRPGRAAGTPCPPPSPPRGSPNKQKCGHSGPVPHCLSRPASTLSTRPPPELPRSCRARTAVWTRGPRAPVLTQANPSRE